MSINRKQAIHEFMQEYKSIVKKANRAGADIYMLYRELYAFYAGMTRAISYDDDMALSEYRLIYKFMFRKIGIFYDAYVLNKEIS